MSEELERVAQTTTTADTDMEDVDRNYETQSSQPQPPRVSVTVQQSTSASQMSQSRVKSSQPHLEKEEPEPDPSRERDLRYRDRDRDRLPSQSQSQCHNRPSGARKAEHSKSKDSISTCKDHGGGGGGRQMSLSDENLLLRRHLRKQEEKIQLLATKLVRLVNERRGKEKRDEIHIEEQKERISQLERQVQILTEKLTLSRQQLTSYTKLIPHINIIPGSASASASMSISNKASAVKSTSSLSAKGHSKKSSTRPASCLKSGTLDHEFTSRVEQLLLEAKAENQALEDQLRVTRECLGVCEHEAEILKEKMREKETAHQEELLRLKGKIDLEAQSTKKKKTLSDNIQLIRLQRESRRTASWLSTTETQCRSLESALSGANETISVLESQVSTLQDEVRENGQKNLNLQKDLEDASAQLNRLKEVETDLKALQEENEILKQTNERVVEKSLSSASLRDLRERKRSGSEMSLDEMRSLRTKIAQQEEELLGKIRLHEELNSEREQRKYCQQRIDSLEKQLLQKTQNQNQNQVTLTPTPTTASTNSNNSASGSAIEIEKGRLQERILELEKTVAELGNELAITQRQLSQVRDELEKTKSLLQTEMSRNGECQREIELLTGKLDDAETGHGEKLREFMALLEQRTNQMATLEQTLESLSKDGTFTLLMKNRECLCKCQSQSQIQNEDNPQDNHNNNDPKSQSQSQPQSASATPTGHGSRSRSSSTGEGDKPTTIILSPPLPPIILEKDQDQGKDQNEDGENVQVVHSEENKLS